MKLRLTSLFVLIAVILIMVLVPGLPHPHPKSDKGAKAFGTLGPNGVEKPESPPQDLKPLLPAKDASLEYLPDSLSAQPYVD